MFWADKNACSASGTKVFITRKGTQDFLQGIRKEAEASLSYFRFYDRTAPEVPELTSLEYLAK